MTDCLYAVIWWSNYCSQERGQSEGGRHVTGSLSVRVSSTRLALWCDHMENVCSQIYRAVSGWALRYQEHSLFSNRKYMLFIFVRQDKYLLIRSWTKTNMIKFPQTGDRFHSVCFIQPVLNAWPKEVKEVNGYLMSEDKKQSENTTFQLPIKSWPFSVRTETPIGRFLWSYCTVRRSSNGGCVWSRRSLQDILFILLFAAHLGLQLDSLFSWKGSCFPKDLLGMKILFLLRGIKLPCNPH